MSEIIGLFETNEIFRIVTLLILGMCIGSFVNVVVYRLPIILDRVWRGQCHELLGEECKIEIATDKFTLSYPSSHCPNCKANVPWWSNIPLFGYLLLMGRCVACKQKISIRYPMVEIIYGILFAVTGFLYHDLFSIISIIIFLSIVFCLMLIDLDTYLLPDELTLPLLWLGLLANLNGAFSGSLAFAVVGAVVGYLILWSIYWGFKLLTGKEGMGYGDFKLLAAIGAWLGWQNLISVLLLSSVLGIIYAIVMRVVGKLDSGKAIPFGPFLGGGAIATLFFGAHLFPVLLG